MNTPALIRPFSGRFRWAIVALLFFAAAINYLDRQMLGLLKPVLAQELHWDERDYSRIAMAFQGAYAAGQVLFGPLIQWLGTKAAFTCSVAFWSLAAMAHAATRSALGFSVVRGALGLGEAGNWPASIRTVAEWFPQKERALATGIFNSGTNASAIFAPLLVPWLAQACGWRTAFVLLGGTGLLWLVFWQWLYHSPERPPHVSAGEQARDRDGTAPQAAGGVSWRQLLAFRQTWAYVLGGLLIGPVWWFYGFWLPDFFHKRYGLDMRAFGLPLVFIYATACCGGIAAGWLSSRLLQRGWSVNAARKSTLLLCCLATVPVAFVTRAHSAWLAAGIFALALAAHQGWSANMYTAVSDLFPARAVATVVGLGGTVASCVSLPFFWYVGDRLQATGRYDAILLVCGGAYPLALGIFHLLAPRMNPVLPK